MAVEILMPELGESVHEATVTRWLVEEGQSVREDDPVVEIMTDKVNTELPAPATGVLSKILVPEGGTVEVFKPMGLIEVAAEATSKTDGPAGSDTAKDAPSHQAEGPQTKPEPNIVEEARSRSGERRWYSPVVRSIAKDKGISESELAAVAGTGAGGRLTKRDLEDYLASKAVGGAAGSEARPQAEAAPTPRAATIEPGQDQEVKRLEPMRKMIADAMLRASQVPTVSTVVQIDVSEMVRFREANKDAFQKQHGVKLTYTPFFIKALTEALIDLPTVNASLQDDQVIVNHAVHMGIAVALGSKGDEGLIVPVIRDCHKKSIVEIAKDLDAIAARARGNALKPADVQGGTFTLSNPGSYGALFGAPMIVAPQAAIGGAYGIQKLPVVVNDDMIAIRSMMYFALTYDHRIIDGLLAGRFLQAVKKRLEAFDFFL